MSYLLAAYVVVLLAVLAYLVIHALKLARLERELEALASARAAEEPYGREDEVEYAEVERSGEEGRRDGR